jgi:hypothetical protein
MIYTWPVFQVSRRLSIACGNPGRNYGVAVSMMENLKSIVGSICSEEGIFDDSSSGNKYEHLKHFVFPATSFQIYENTITYVRLDLFLLDNFHVMLPCASFEGYGVAIICFP